MTYNDLTMVVGGVGRKLNQLCRHSSDTQPGVASNDRRAGPARAQAPQATARPPATIAPPPAAAVAHKPIPAAGCVSQGSRVSDHKTVPNAGRADAPEDPHPIAEAEALLRSLSLVFSNASFYSPDHDVTRESMRDTFALFQRVLTRCEALRFSTCEDLAVLNDRVVRSSTALVKSFVSHIQCRDIGGFSVARGVTRDEFDALLDVLAARPEELTRLGGFAAVVQILNLGNIAAMNISYKRLANGQVVVFEGANNEGGDGAAKTAKERGAPQAKEASKTAQEPAPEQALPFLTGSGSPDVSTAVPALATVVNDPSRLSALVVQAAETCHAQVEFSGGRSMAALSIVCLQRAYQALVADSSADSLKGRKRICKTLETMEQEILERLKENNYAVSDDDAIALAETIEGMTDELTIEALACDYVKKRQAIDANEQRIVRYLKAKGAQAEDCDLRDKLLGSGLTLSGWTELLAKSGVRRDTMSEGIAAVGHLASLLAELEHNIDTENAGADSASAVLKRILDEVEHELKRLADRAERKILKLIEAMHSEEELLTTGDAEHDPHKRLSRKKLVELLAEIVQELLQPLTVITCAIDSIRSNRLGPVNESQQEVLNLASEGARRLKILFGRLGELSGLPHDLSPDAAILSELYGVTAA